MSNAITKATRLTLILINFLFVCVGLCGIVLGGWVLVYREEIQTLTLIDVATEQLGTEQLGLLQTAAILTLSAGVLLFALGFVGCFAAYTKQRCLQVVYIGLVILCCVLTIVGCVVTFQFRDDVEEGLLDHLQSRLKTEYQGYSTSELDFSRAWDWAQVEFECCGIRNATADYKTAQNWTVRNSAIVPLSCCILYNRNDFLDDNFYNITDRRCVTFPNSTNSNVHKPCYDEVKAWMEEDVVMLGAVAIVAIILQILAVLFLVCLMRQPAKNSDNLYRENMSDSFN